MGEETSLVTAISDDHIAVVLSNSSASVLRVGVYLATDLQATLTYKTTEPVQKVLFVNPTTVTALLQTVVVVWDLQRSVVSYTYPSDNSSQLDLLDCHVLENSLHILVAKSEKLYIHIIDEQGNVKGKVKAGKHLKESKMALLKGGVVAVVQGKELRFIELQTGEKTKVALPLASAQIAAEAGLVYVALPGKVQMYSADGKEQGTFSIDTSVQHWQVANERVLINDTHLYYNTQLSRKFHVEPTIAKASLLLNHDDVWAVMQKGSLQVRRLDLANADSSDETFVVNWEEDQNIMTEETKAEEKRKAVVLGPGQAGGEARQIKDVSAKRQKFEEGEEHEDEEGPTIAERLEQLQKALDEDDEGSDKEMDIVDGGDEDGVDLASSFQPKKATTESLSQLLQQALQSGNDGLLELALSVKDAKVIETTCATMPSDLLSVLLTALTSRLALKPSRAEYLCTTWLFILLRTGRIRSPEQLQTLRNIVQERVEVFPALLQLEGKLSLLG